VIDHTIAEATTLLGFDASVLPADVGQRRAFNSALTQRPLPPRTAGGVVLAKDKFTEEIAAAATRLAAPCRTLDDIEIDALLGASTAIVPPSIVDTPALVAAFAAGCYVMLDGEFSHHELQPGTHYAVLPALADSSFRAGAAELVAAAIKGSAKFEFAAEAARRVVMSRMTSVQIAIDALIKAGAFDAQRWTDLQRQIPQAVDPYMWQNERLLFAVLLANLPPTGMALELGVGDGGTLATLTLGGRPTTGIDDYSFNRGTQKDRVKHACDMTGANVIESKTNDCNWGEPLSFLHVDAGHEFADCWQDLDRYAPHVVAGGVLAIDDYGTDKDMPGVRRATDEYMRIHADKWAPICAAAKVAFWRRLPEPAAPELTVDVATTPNLGDVQ